MVPAPAPLSGGFRALLGANGARFEGCWEMLAGILGMMGRLSRIDELVGPIVS